MNLKGILKQVWWILLSVVMIGGAIYVKWLRPLPEAPVILHVMPGQQLAPIALFDSNGGEQRLTSVPGRRQVLYIFSPFCAWCKKNEPSVRTLLECLGSSADFIAVSIGFDGLNDYFSAGWPPYRVLVDRYRATGISETPTTILVDERGTISHVWRGAFGGAVRSEIGLRFNCELPKLSS